MSTRSPAPDPAIAKFFDEIDQRNGALEAALVFNAAHDSGFVGKKMRDFRQGMHKSSFSSVWFTAQPISAALTTRVFLCACVFYTMYFFMQTSQCIQLLLFPHSPRYQHFRFTVLELRGNSSSCVLPSSPSIESFGVLHDSCPGDGMEQIDRWQLGQHYGISFSKPVRMNSWWFRTRVGAGPDADPVRFKLCGCGQAGLAALDSAPGKDASAAQQSCEAADEGAWEVISTSSWIALPCRPPLYVDGKYDTRTQRGQTEQFSLRPGWGQALNLLSLVMLTTANGLQVVFGWVGSQRHSRKVLLTAWLSACGLLTASGTVCANGADSTLLLGAAGLFGIQFTWMFLFERHLTGYLIGIGVLRFLYGSLSAAYIHSSGLNASSVSIHHWVGLSQVVLGACVLVSRLRVVRAAKLLVAADAAHYRRIWEQVQQMEGFAASQKVLRGELDAFRESETNPAPRQLGRKVVMSRPQRAGGSEWLTEARRGPCEGGRGGWWNLGSSHLARIMAGPSTVFRMPSFRQGKGVAGEEDLVPVTCIDRVLLQAAMLVPELSKKVVWWSVQSRGCFVDRATKRVTPWAEVVKAQAPPDTIACVKKPERAIEKVLRLYRDDVSVLTDVCRASIVFDNIHDLLTCVRAIKSDPECSIVRAKNRYDDQYDSEHTAGYRDVGLNLRLDNPRTRSMGLEHHICELQLLMRSFAEVKSEQGHARYVIFRNALGT